MRALQGILNKKKDIIHKNRMEHKNLGDKTLLLFMLKRSGFFLFSCIIIFLVISFSGMLPDAFSRYVNFADFGLVVDPL
jgi:hypothetical protein